jgi:FHIPEP family
MQRRQGKISGARVEVQVLAFDEEPDDLLRRLSEAAAKEVAVLATDNLHTLVNRLVDLIHDDSAMRVLIGFGEFVPTAAALEVLLNRLPAVSIGGRRLASKPLNDALRRHLPNLLSQQSVPVALQAYRRALLRHAHEQNDPLLMREALCWSTWSWIGRPLFATEFGEAYPAAFAHLMSLRSIASRDWYFDREAGIPEIYRARSLVQPSDDTSDQFHLYLTGAGGTGKSCFLRYVYETIEINQPDTLPVWYKVDAPSSEWEDVVRRVKEEVVKALARRTDQQTAKALTDERKDLPFFLTELVDNFKAKKLPIRRVALFIDQLERTFESGESPELFRLVAISRAFVDLLSKVGTGNGIRIFIASRKQYLPDFLSSYQKASEYNLHFNVLQRIAGDEQVPFVRRVLNWCRDNDLVSVRLHDDAAREIAAASDGHPLEMMLALIQLFSLDHRGDIGKREVEKLKPWEKIFYADEQFAAKDDLDWYFFLAMAHARTEIVRFEEVWWRLRLVNPQLTGRVDGLRPQGVLERMWLLGHLGRTIYPRPLDDDPARFLEFFHANMRDHLIGSVMNFGGDEAGRGGRRGGTPAVWRALDRLTAAARDWKQSQQLLLREDVTELMQHKDVFVEPLKSEHGDKQVAAFYLLFLRDNKDKREDLYEAAKECFVYSAVVHDVLGRWAFRALYRNVADQVGRCRAWLGRSDSASRIRLLQYLVELRDGRADAVLAQLVLRADDPAPGQQLADVLVEPLYAARYRRAFVRALFREALEASPGFPTNDTVTARFGAFLAAACRADRDELLAVLEALAKDVARFEEDAAGRAVSALLEDSNRLYGWVADNARKGIDLAASSRSIHNHVPPRLELRGGAALAELITPERLGRWRGEFEARIGLPIPGIVLTDGEVAGADAAAGGLNDHELELRIDGRIASLGDFYPERVQTLRRHWALGELEPPDHAMLSFNEGLEESVVWMSAADLDEFHFGRARTDPDQAVFDWLHGNLRRNVGAVFTLYDLMQYLTSLEQLGDPRFDLREFLRTMSGNFPAVWRLLIDFARERVPLAEVHIELMLELQELVRQMRRSNLVLIMQKLREHVGLQICRQFTHAGNQLPVLLMDAELERRLVTRLHIAEDRRTLTVTPEEGMTVAAALRTAFDTVLRTEDIAPVLVCEDALRAPIQRLVWHFESRIYVLSYTELAPEIRPESKGVVIATIPPRLEETADAAV